MIFQFISITKKDYTNMNDKVDIKNLFNGLQKTMISKLETIRGNVQHAPTMGNGFEEEWIDWFKTYLPNKYGINSAIVIDYEGNKSDQIDIVIYDSLYTPFMFNENDIKYIPAEGVYAIFEVKPEMSKDYIQYAGKKIESVRKLIRTSTDIINAGQTWNARPLTKILGGILTNTNSFASNDKVKEHMSNLNGFQGIDIGCMVDSGMFYVDYIGEEDITKKEKDQFIERYTEYYENRKIKDVIFSEKDNSLVAFFLQLTRYLQQAVGTVPAIDLSAYSKAIDFEIDEKL